MIKSSLPYILIPGSFLPNPQPSHLLSPNLTLPIRDIFSSTFVSILRTVSR
jgi:hypothetical protein